ncbi:MAG TPA: InlB B-repeat-containing protein [Acholeplasmataceae bacterium]|nr:InlB B-repeat-containing protein [Acholeplasmataceae bacterium]
MKKLVLFFASLLLSIVTSSCGSTTTISVVFEENGGLEVENMQISIDSTTINLPTPTRDGYTFDGWYLKSDLTQPFSLTSLLSGSGTLTLYAKWTATVVTSTITFEENGGSEVANLTQASNTTVTAPANPTKMGYTFGGWYSDIGLTSIYTFTTMPEENIILYAKWIINDYTISFNEAGGSEVSDITQAYNTAVTAPNNPTKIGYSFDGWYTDAELSTAYTFGTMPANNMTLYAKWTINQTVSDFEHPITVHSGDLVDVNIVMEGQAFYYFFTPITSGNYRVFSQGNQDTYLSLFNESLDIIDFYDDGSNDSNFDFVYYFVSGQSYYIVVELYDEDETGSFTWSIEHFTIDFDGAIEIYKDVNIEVNITVPGNNQYFVFTAPVSGYYEIYSLGDQDTYVSIYNQNEALLDSDDDGATDYNFGIAIYFEGGQDYYIVVGLYDNDDTGSFTWSIEKITTGFLSAIEVLEGATITVDITVPGSDQYFVFTALVSGYYEIYSQGDQDTYLSVYNQNELLIDWNDDGGVDYNFGLSIYFEGGQDYYIVVELYDEIAGSFTWSINQETSGFDEATEVYEGNTITVNITVEGDSLFYKFTPITSGNYYIYSEGENDTYLYVYDEHKELFDSNDDGGDEANFGLICAFESGKTYYIVVELYDEEITGSFTWKIEKRS